MLSHAPPFSLLLLCILCGSLSANAQFGAHSSWGVGTAPNRSPDPAVPHEMTREAFDRAARHSAENAFLDHRHLGPDDDSHHARAHLKDASGSAQDIWQMLDPSNFDSVTTETTDNGGERDPESDAMSIDEALDYTRHLIRILSRTHDALLESKLAKLPLMQRLWYRLSYSYGHPPVEHHKATQKQKGHTAQSNLANSAGELVSVSGKSDVSKRSINAVTATFAKELLLSISALKDAARNAAHGGWLATPEIKARVAELTHDFTAVSHKWLQKIEFLADAAKPLAANLKDMEQMVNEFQDELWRLRTEFIYKRSETLLWASENLSGMKELGMHELDRLSESLHTRVNGTKQLLRHGLERNRAYVSYLQQHAVERVNHFVGLLVLWMDVSKGLLTTVVSMLKYYIEKLWRLIAFVAVIVFFRFLLNFMNVDASVQSFVTSALSRRKVSRSPPRGSRPGRGSGPVPEGVPAPERVPASEGIPAPERVPRSPQSETSRRSESSESKPVKKGTTSATAKTASHVVSKSQDRETVSPNHDVVVSSAAELQERGTPPRTETAKTPKAATPFRISNCDYQTTLSDVGQQKEGEPICIGDHEVQLVYDDTPRGTLSNDSKNELDCIKSSKATKRTSLRRTPRRQKKQLSPELQAETTVEDNISGSTSGFVTANSRQTRSSARRASARLSYLR